MIINTYFAQINRNETYKLIAIFSLFDLINLKVFIVNVNSVII